MVEGLPRSANSFCVNAIELAFQSKVCVGGHRHVFNSVRDSIDRDIPVIVMIREPASQVSSLLMKYSIGKKAPKLFFSALLRLYKEYYLKVWANIGSITLVSFDDITSDLDGTIKQLATLINEDPRETVNTKLVFDRIKQKKLLREEKGRGRANFNLTVAYPTEEKEILKRELIQKIRSNEEYQAAFSIYNNIIEHHRNRGNISSSISCR
ncbi:MAG: hypothetical protein ACPGYM_00890 [Flavobacteriales bacterium]